MPEQPPKHYLIRSLHAMGKSVRTWIERNIQSLYVDGRTSSVQLMEWSQEHRNHIRGQLQSLGGLLNWDQEVLFYIMPIITQFYTLDPDYQKLVSTSFIQLFSQGDIYRGEKMLHFCPTLQSVVSDIEVDWIVFLIRSLMSGIGHFKTPDNQTPIRKGDRGWSDI